MASALDKGGCKGLSELLGFCNPLQTMILSSIHPVIAWSCCKRQLQAIATLFLTVCVSVGMRGSTYGGGAAVAPLCVWDTCNAHSPHMCSTGQVICISVCAARRSLQKHRRLQQPGLSIGPRVGHQVPTYSPDTRRALLLCHSDHHKCVPQTLLSHYTSTKLSHNCSKA